MAEKVYTRKGDDGSTQLLFSGRARVSKASLRTTAYGEADEAVSALGVGRAEATASGEEELADLLLRLERELFVLNAELATPAEHADRLQDGVSRVTQDMVDALERVIDSLTTRFEQPKDFIVPGNTRLGAALDHATRIVRRAERSVVALADVEEVGPPLRRYLNRLSDLTWVMARFAERDTSQPRPRE